MAASRRTPGLWNEAREHVAHPLTPLVSTQVGDAQEALRLYDAALAAMDAAGHAGLDLWEEASLAPLYAARAQCHLQLGNPRAALDDVECALTCSEKLPGTLRAKLLERQVRSTSAARWRRLGAGRTAPRGTVGGGGCWGTRRTRALSARSI